MDENRGNGMALNVGSGDPISISEVASVLTDALGKPLPTDITGKYRAGDIRHCFADISTTRRVLGYEPKFKFSDGVRELVEWLRSQSAVDRAQEATAQLNAYGLTA
jgi:dTDP-L-rhamnose 4-epimerase